MTSVGKLGTVEEIQAVIAKWESQFGRVDVEDESSPMMAGGGAAGDAMDVDTPDVPGDESDALPRVAGVKRRREPSEERDEHTEHATETIPLALPPEPTGVEGPPEDGKDYTAWIQNVPTPSTRGEAARQEASTKPVSYQSAEKVTGNAPYKPLKRRVRAALKQLIAAGEDYWPPFKPDSELWETSDASVRSHVESLKMPTVPLRKGSLPDPLLYRLGRLSESGPGDLPPLDPDMDARLRPFLAAEDSDCLLKNAAGVGKTRWMFELLVRCFGIYLNFAHDATTNPYGSRDTITAQRTLQFGDRNVHASHTYFQPVVEGDSADAVNIRQSNEKIAAHLYELLVLARVLVFNWFLELYKKEHGRVDTSAAYLWTLLQIRPQLGTVSDDVFDDVFRSLLMMERDSCEAQINAAQVSCEAFGCRLSIIALDEVHVPVNQFTTAFPSFTKKANATRPLLKSVLVSVRRALQKWRPRALVAATEFNERIITEAIGSTSFKPTRLGPHAFTSFGDYSQRSMITHVLQHYFGPAFVPGISDLMRSHIDFWLAGRRRFLMTFIQWTLRQGTLSMLTVLRQLVDTATGFQYAGVYEPIPGFAFRNLLPPELQKTEVPVAEITMRQKLQHAVTFFIIKGVFPSWGDDMRELVTHGLGCFVPNPDAGGKEVVTINESLVLTTLLRWLLGAETGEKSLSSFLDQAMAHINASVRGFAFEDVVMFILWQAFSTLGLGTPLDRVFNFRYLPPSWGSEPARLIQVFKDSSPNRKPYPLSAGITTRIGYAAQTADDTLAFFTSSNVRDARIPFLQPDGDCGPDLMFGLLLRQYIELLVSVQCKCWSAKHYAGDVFKAVLKASPEGFYTAKGEPGQQREENRKQFLELLDQFATSDNLPMPVAPGEPKYTMIRVLATFDSNVAWPEFDDSYGDYPIATLSDEFLKTATVEFSALERAYNAARENRVPASL
ncbi:hypothetical protein AURDEDRAFT_117027 [Auricularia subglabra TFB-10046 SS5]|uniref:Uncharacterized protein n=1 Tax=Auricularia subglabra (strain TFB-10046 / SS5) TaxID=717982 RepID=J0CZ60_AURST|nr:hypothetical protein AURDEDRAFT_117027 [Auricularia subglabra TFB-10046 SS5]